MTQEVSFEGYVYDLESEALQEAFAAATDLRANRPLCLCRDPGVPMYVAAYQGKFSVKRMPNSAEQHAPSCESFEAPPTVSGLSSVEGKAVVYGDDDAFATLRLSFALSKERSSHSPAVAPTVATSAKAPPARLGLRGLMEYLWEKAGLNRWTPAMRGKRNYSVVYKYVGQQLALAGAKRMLLTETLYMPEPFSGSLAHDIGVRAMNSLHRCRYQHSSKQPLMVVFGEVKSISPVRDGAIVVFKHAPFLEFHVPQVLKSRLEKMFEVPLLLWNAGTESHLMMAGTFAENAAHMNEVIEASLMLVDAGWIPVESVPQSRLYSKLATEGRAFYRGMRFAVPPEVPMADVLLTDTPVPAAVYLMPAVEPEGLRDGLLEDCVRSGLVPVFITPGEIETAVFPAVDSARPSRA